MVVERFGEGGKRTTKTTRKTRRGKIDRAPQLLPGVGGGAGVMIKLDSSGTGGRSAGSVLIGWESEEGRFVLITLEFCGAGKCGHILIQSTCRYRVSLRRHTTVCCTHRGLRVRVRGLHTVPWAARATDCCRLSRTARMASPSKWSSSTATGSWLAPGRCRMTTMRATRLCCSTSSSGTAACPSSAATCPTSSGPWRAAAPPPRPPHRWCSARPGGRTETCAAS